MPLLTIHVEGVEAVRVRLATLRAELPTALARSIERAANELAAQLSEAAPKGRSGASDGAQPSGLLAGDAPGPLAESFRAEVTNAGAGGGMVRAVVLTTQPAKLRLVRSGRGPVTPRQKRALMWEGLEHPVMHAGPVAANDFVTPIAEQAGATVAAIVREDLAALLNEG